MRYFRFCLLCLTVLSHIPLVTAEGFVSDLNMGLTLNRGNTENSLMNFGLETERERENDELRASVSYKYGKTKQQEDDGRSSSFTSSDSTEAKFQYNRFFTERAYALLGLSFFRDELSDVQYRMLTGPGLGYYLVKNGIWTLSVEAGMSYLREKVGGATDDYAVFRFAQMYERDLSENASVWQNIEILPESDDFENYLLNAEIGAQAKINGNLSLRVVLTQRYDSTPADGNEYSDWSLVSGISYRF